MSNEPFCFAQGTMTVITPRGYWFTSGGDKGSFGYYPHLKDEKGYPIYPDTQIMGDLKMATQWLIDILPKEQKEYLVGLIPKIFGARGDNSSGCLFSTDFELTDDSKSTWNKEQDKNRFEIKPRTSIEDGLRTVESHMFVNLEMAYLKRLALTADVYLYGTFEEKDFQAARKLLSEACCLLSGFGAFRSRGYGSGKVELQWKEEKRKEGKTIEAHPTLNNAEGTYTYALTAQVNFRNKQIEPGTDQLLISRPFITSEQVRAWFVKAYHAVSGNWPTPEQMKLLIFTPLYPSLRGENGSIIHGFPPAMTTLRNEDDEEKDVAGRSVKEKDKKGDVGEFFNTKTKPFTIGTYVTDEDYPRTISVASGRRIRNSIDEKFVTLTEGGLFVQEYIKRGTTFAGMVSFCGSDHDFISKAQAILKEVKPIINGCIFTPSFSASAKAPEKNGNFALVSAPLHFIPDGKLLNFDSCSYRKSDPNDSESRIELDKANQITIDTHRRYNTTLNRPRRPRIVIAPGSVLCGSAMPEELKERTEAVLFWKGFGNDFEKKGDHETKGDGSSGSDGDKKVAVSKDEKLENLVKGLIDIEKMTRSQAGFLREFLHTRDLKVMEEIARDRKEKFEKKGKKHYKELYEEIERYLRYSKSDEMRAFIDNLLDHLYGEWWNKDIGE